MFDDSDKEYLDLKFGDVIKEVRETTKQNTSDIINIDKKIDNLFSFKDDHIKIHDNMKADRKWRWDNIIVVLIACVTILISVLQSSP